MSYHIVHRKFSLKKLLSKKERRDKKAREDAATKKAAQRLRQDLAIDKARIERAKRNKRNGR
jgi:hypothetical protein